MFRILRNGLDHLRMLTDAAYHDWQTDNVDGCLTRFEEAATDCETLASQIRKAIADLKAETVNSQHLTGP